MHCKPIRASVWIVSNEYSIAESPTAATGTSGGYGASYEVSVDDIAIEYWRGTVHEEEGAHHTPNATDNVSSGLTQLATSQVSSLSTRISCIQRLRVLSLSGQ